MPELRNFKGIWIPAEIWLSKELTMQEKLFLVEIDSLSKTKKGCYASNSYFAEFFNISKPRCTQIIKSLEEKKVVKIKLKIEGKQIKKRSINISSKGVVNILNRGSKFSKQGSKFSKGIFTKVNKNSIEDNKKSISLSPPSENDSDKLINTSNKYFKLASKLSDIIQTVRSVKHTKTILNQWASEFKKLETLDGVPIERQKIVLEWYSSSIGGEYIPVAHSGASFRKKFSNLEAAIKRENYHNKPKSSRTNGYRDHSIDYKNVKTIKM